MKRFGLIGLVTLSALALGACDDGSGDDGAGGAGGENGGNGAGNASGDDESCTVKDNGDGTATISCPDGTEVDVSTTPADEIEQCTVVDNGDGTATITCPDGSSVTTGVSGFGGDELRFVVLNSDLSLHTISGVTTSSERLNPPLGTTGTVFDYVTSADNTKVLYLNDIETSGVSELHLVDISGDPTTPVKVNGSLQATGNVITYGFSPDGNWVAYIADQATEGVNELYVVDISGDEPATPVKVSGTLVAGGGALSFRFSPDSSTLAFLADRVNDTVNELHLVNLSNPGAGVRVNPALVATRAVEADYAFSADSAELYYRADQLTSNVVELFVSDVSSGSPKTPVEVSQIDAGIVERFLVSPDGQYVTYQLGSGLGDTEVFLVERDSFGTATPLFTASTVIASDVLADARYSSDSSQILFRAPYVVDDQPEIRLVSVSFDGDEAEDPVDLSPNVETSGAVDSFQLSPSGNLAVFAADLTGSGYSQLYLVDVTDPGAPLRANSTLPAYTGVGSYQWAEAADVLWYQHPTRETYCCGVVYYGTGVVNLTGDEPARRVFLNNTQWDYHYYQALTEDGEHIYIGLYDSDSSKVFDVASGVGVPSNTSQNTPVEWVNPLD